MEFTIESTNTPPHTQFGEGTNTCLQQPAPSTQAVTCSSDPDTDAESLIHLTHTHTRPVGGFQDKHCSHPSDWRLKTPLVPAADKETPVAPVADTTSQWHPHPQCDSGSWHKIILFSSIPFDKVLDEIILLKRTSLCSTYP